MKILIADNFNPIVDDLINKLKILGYDDIEIANTMQDAIFKANSSTSLIISDYNLPDNNGIELLKRIRSGWESVRLVPFIILCTEKDLLKTWHAAKKYKTEMLIKGYSVEQLEYKINLALNKK